MPGIVTLYSARDRASSVRRYSTKKQLKEFLTATKDIMTLNSRYRIHILPDDIPCDHIPTLEELKACINKPQREYARL